ncbi:hypothetical protein HYDPIDRAFT_175333 [Hydnomerulius pinastri MD-312]|uniref:Nucleoporin Nup54 alpha-helical domain-containing protein n=1 Tax=Hydnomerulius pinastri MD-312 TaxID=994086 RepID=A0A0C9VGV2_9AGAM|nr:hypothetical protein HYDPIDRAFT_175333 [Hydnomerulius pinastri MD-312]
MQHYLHHLADPGHVSLYGRPPNVTNEALWQRAMRTSPDRRCMVPVLALGFDALNATAQQDKASTLLPSHSDAPTPTCLQSLTATHHGTTLPRVYRALSQQMHISHRLLKLIQHVHLLIPTVLSSIRPEEEALCVALEDMEEYVRRPGEMNKMMGKFGGDAGVGWAVLDEEGLKQIAQILSDQQAGLQHLTKILQRDLKDVGVMMGTNGEGEDSRMTTKNWFSSSTSICDVL